MASYPRRCVERAVVPARDGFRAYYVDPQSGLVFERSRDRIDWRGPPTPVRLQDSQGRVGTPWIFRPAGGGYRMIYAARSETACRLRLALSADGENFQPVGSAPLLPDAPEDVDLDTGLVDQRLPSGVRSEDGSMQLYFLAGGMTLASARSFDDGLSWTRGGAGAARDDAMPGARRFMAVISALLG